jgi:uncharacterized membrane protein YfcA
MAEWAHRALEKTDDDKILLSIAAVLLIFVGILIGSVKSPRPWRWLFGLIVALVGVFLLSARDDLV